MGDCQSPAWPSTSGQFNGCSIRCWRRASPLAGWARRRSGSLHEALSNRDPPRLRVGNWHPLPGGTARSELLPRSQRPESPRFKPGPPAASPGSRRGGTASSSLKFLTQDPHSRSSFKILIQDPHSTNAWLNPDDSPRAVAAGLLIEESRLPSSRNPTGGLNIIQEGWLFPGDFFSNSSTRRMRNQTIKTPKRIERWQQPGNRFAELPPVEARDPFRSGLAYLTLPGRLRDAAAGESRIGDSLRIDNQTARYPRHRPRPRSVVRRWCRNRGRACPGD